MWPRRPEMLYRHTTKFHDRENGEYRANGPWKQKWLDNDPAHDVDHKSHTVWLKHRHAKKERIKNDILNEEIQEEMDKEEAKQYRQVAEKLQIKASMEKEKQQ